MDTDTILPGRRVTPERRVLSWRTVIYGFLLSRRVTSRRQDSTEELFADWHPPWLFFLALGTMVLSCTDAFLTLQLISRGMIEANPLMAAAMNYGTEVFVATKVAGTGIAILLLVFCSRVLFLNQFRTGLLLTLFFCLYSCLVCYEIVCLLGMS